MDQARRSSWENSSKFIITHCATWAGFLQKTIRWFLGLQLEIRFLGLHSLQWKAPEKLTQNALQIHISRSETNIDFSEVRTILHKVHLRTSKRRLILSAQEKRERAHGLRTSASLFNTSVALLAGADWWKYHQPGSSYLDVRNRCALSFLTWTTREFRLPPQRSAPSEVRYLYYCPNQEKKTIFQACLKRISDFFAIFLMMLAPVHTFFHL